MEIVIRPATLFEAYDIAKLVADSRGVPAANPLDQSSVTDCAENIADAELNAVNGLCVVAADTAIRGILYAKRLPDYQEIQRLFVADGYRGQGIGRRLLSAYDTWADRHVYHRVALAPDNYQAVGMYTRRGYRFIGNSLPTRPDDTKLISMQRPKEVI